MTSADVVVLGGGAFGLYSALVFGQRDMSVLVLERDEQVFSRASSINQARVHLGYHYPRSLGTAETSIYHFDEFVRRYFLATDSDFDQIYAIASTGSMTSAKQFERFCEFLSISAEQVDPIRYFQKGAVEACYKTREVSIDAPLFKSQMLEEVSRFPNVNIRTRTAVKSVEVLEGKYHLELHNGFRVATPLVINATYAALNEAIEMFSLEPIRLRYELSEVALGQVPSCWQRTGIMLMDGPFFSTMPFGKSGYHSLTAVDFTPHARSSETLPVFSCQSPSNGCRPYKINTCTSCPDRPSSAAPFMAQLAKKYLNDSFAFDHVKSLFTVKTILHQTEVDDGRPTYSNIGNKSPTFVSVFSGKINTIFELDQLLRGLCHE